VIGVVIEIVLTEAGARGTLLLHPLPVGIFQVLALEDIIISLGIRLVAQNAARDQICDDRFDGRFAAGEHFRWAGNWRHRAKLAIPRELLVDEFQQRDDDLELPWRDVLVEKQCPAPSALGLLDRAPGNLRIDLERSLTTGPDRFLHFPHKTACMHIHHILGSSPITEATLVNHLRCGGQSRNRCEFTSNGAFSLNDAYVLVNGDSVHHLDRHFFITSIL
jgi:hypothetical protein